jgi:dienelactone hydrolase
VIYREYAGPDARVTGDQRTADADAALSYLRSRAGEDARLAIGGSSCGVYHALSTAARRPQQVRAVIALTGPHTPAHAEFVRAHADVALFSGTAIEDVPAPDWARELKAASPNPASRMALADGKAHGTDIFSKDPIYADQLAHWIASQLKGSPAPK